MLELIGTREASTVPRPGGDHWLSLAKWVNTAPAEFIGALFIKRWQRGSVSMVKSAVAIWSNNSQRSSLARSGVQNRLRSTMSSATTLLNTGPNQGWLNSNHRYTIDATKFPMSCTPAVSKVCQPHAQFQPEMKLSGAAQRLGDILATQKYWPAATGHLSFSLAILKAVYRTSWLQRLPSFFLAKGHIHQAQA